MTLTPKKEEFDIVVVGAGLGGIYALHTLSRQGHKVIGVEQSNQLGGVWNLNGYPGARVDVEPAIYSYYFSDELYRNWRWRERYPTQRELLSYLNHVADMLEVRDLIRFNARVTGALWRSDKQHYEVKIGEDRTLYCRFLVMATGNLTEPRDAGIPGVDTFKGRVLKTSRWPQEAVEFSGRRVGIIGTGSSGVQAIPVIAEQAAHLYVFQRSAHYAVPAQNRLLDYDRFDHIAERKALLQAIENRWAGATLSSSEKRSGRASDYTPAGQLERLEAFWKIGGQGLQMVFADQATNVASANLVADFVRSKIRETVEDPQIAAKLCPHYPFGIKRIANAIDYYETYNRSNVTLVDIQQDPIVAIAETGIQTAASFYALDVIVLALGFKAFSGAIDNANIGNELGDTPTSHWTPGPKTLLGLMTCGFPNLFMLTGPGSPSVAGNVYQLNEFHAQWVNDCITYMNANGYTTIEPSTAAVEDWTNHVAEVGQQSLRSKLANYMSYETPNGGRAMIPFVGPMNAYYREAAQVAAEGYRGFKLGR
jgi:cation diffusion facilitator CzcD-associated flavoprotein CzcO